MERVTRPPSLRRLCWRAARLLRQCWRCGAMPAPLTVRGWRTCDRAGRALTWLETVKDRRDEYLPEAGEMALALLRDLADDGVRDRLPARLRHRWDAVENGLRAALAEEVTT